MKLDMYSTRLRIEIERIEVFESERESLCLNVAAALQP